MFSFFTRRNKRHTATRRSPRSVGLRLEQLEDRLAPANLITLASFSGIPIGNGPSGVVRDSNGNLYGTTPTGAGTIFELAKGSSTITPLASFGTNGNNASGPSGVILDGSGNLYGTTSGGGANGDGTVFELPKGSSTIKTLAPFDGSNGDDPLTGVIMDSSGNLYGTTSLGGDHNSGTIFEWVKSSSTITKLASFNVNPFFLVPEGALLLDSSGNLYGTISEGGTSNDGTVFELAKGSSTITTLASFDGSNGASPSLGALVMDNSGNLYGAAEAGGTTTSGSPSNDGTVFELAKGSSTITALVSFSGTNGNDPGSIPTSGVILDGNGNLYGTTFHGGADDAGTVFELARGSSTITTLVTFNGSNGNFPNTNYNGLIMDGSGNLYGTTSASLTNDGTIFELVPPPTDQWTGANSAMDNNWSDSANWSNGLPPAPSQTVNFTNNSTVKDFTATVDAPFTIAGLDIDSSWGGTITNNSSLNVTGNFTLASGTFGGNGVTTIAGNASQWTGGTIDVSNGSFTNTGTLTYSGSNNVVLTGAGSLINKKSIIQTGTGTLTLENGATLNNAAGSTYNIQSNGGISQSGDTLTTLASFSSSTGTHPSSGVILDSGGNLYGTTEYGGASFDGTVFELAKGSNTITTVASFNGTNGQDPQAGLILDSSGNLYGTTFFGGASGDGTVFELAKGSSTITTLASFNGANGEDPHTGVVMDSSGNLYGITYFGGASGNGTIFELAKGSGTITTLYSFNSTNGPNPQAGVILDSSGNLYGTLAGGGASGDGTVYELAKGSGSLTTLASFNGANGNSPADTPLMDSSGNLYGTTYAGGANGFGTIFELAHGSGSITTLASFNGPNGGNLDPTGTLILDSSGNLYGTTQFGGTSSDGTAFEVVKGSGTISTLATFDGANGLNPVAGLILDSSGNLYGTTYGGGASSYGTVFRLTQGGGSIVNTGTLEKTAGSGTSTLDAITLNNTGTVKVTSGTLDVSAKVSQASGSTLTAGTWSVNGSATVHATLDITSANHFTTIGTAAHVTLSGLNTIFTNLSALSTIDKGGSFSLRGGQSFTTTGALTNNGSLTLGPGSILTVSGSFTQSSTGTLAIQLGGSNSAPTFGQLVSTTRSVTLGGKLSVTSTVVPTVGSSFEVLDNEGNSAISGTFANLPEGATFTVKKGTTTMTFKISYVGSDGDGSKNVVITRIS
jgi:uncharacterized repeat protein (TIGR03803 family)